MAQVNNGMDYAMCEPKDFDSNRERPVLRRYHLRLQMFWNSIELSLNVLSSLDVMIGSYCIVSFCINVTRLLVKLSF